MHAMASCRPWGLFYLANYPLLAYLHLLKKKPVPERYL